MTNKISFSFAKGPTMETLRSVISGDEDDDGGGGSDNGSGSHALSHLSTTSSALTVLHTIIYVISPPHGVGTVYLTDGEALTQRWAQ